MPSPAAPPGHCSDPASRRVLASVWDRLAFLIEMTADAEEEICHLAVYGTGPLALERIQGAEAELDDIRAAVAEACLQPAGSAARRRAATAALTANRQHLDHRERGPLAGFACRASHALQEELAGQWLAFTSARIAERVPPAQRDGGLPLLRVAPHQEPSSRAGYPALGHLLQLRRMPRPVSPHQDRSWRDAPPATARPTVCRPPNQAQASNSHRPAALSRRQAPGGAARVRAGCRFAGARMQAGGPISMRRRRFRWPGRVPRVTT